MVVILAASFLHEALETLSSEAKEQFKDKSYTIPGLRSIVNTKTSKRLFKNYFQKT